MAGLAGALSELRLFTRSLSRWARIATRDYGPDRV